MICDIVYFSEDHSYINFKNRNAVYYSSFNESANLLSCKAVFNMDVPLKTLYGGIREVHDEIGLFWEAASLF